MSAAKFLRLVAKYFAQGLLVLIPLSLTVGVIIYLYRLLRQYTFEEHPIIGLAIILVGIVLLGFLFSTLLGRPLAALIDNMLGRVPFIKLIYSSIKDLVEAFVGDKKKFNKPVLITVSRDPLVQKPGFITREDLSSIGVHDKVAVYLPYSYSFSGQMLVVYRSDIEIIEGVSSADWMKFVVSGGIADVEEEENPEKTANHLNEAISRGETGV